ncbi:MAG: hypothetical protein A2031_07895 [Deltaproteobacteria bacterium RBG_19FT_COMBO_43_11]|nr:MAG: hypothetical protein A2W27_08180 [Deltaproteobacteria bacterium RBG_16_44_11]OGP87117.1 MAG: hypothetical protein A2031_07895 [Deltaproteobacteria bacterium RBG_19FT_COMBO_43_11]
MIRIQQTKFGNGNGNCLLACVASILERPIEGIPDFNLSGTGWFGELYEWCLNERIGIICVHPKDLEHSLFLNSWCIAVFTTPDSIEETHAVIGKCRRIEENYIEIKDEDKWKWEATVEFDPNPKGVKLGKLEHIVFLLPNQQIRSL